MTRLSAHGMSIAVPAGWEAELTTQQDPASLDDDLESVNGQASSSADAGSADEQTPQRGDENLVVLHAGNFALAAERGDYGSGAVDAMGRNGIFMAVIEFDHLSASARLFASEGVPARLDPDDFAPDQLQMSIAGQAGLQRFFHVGRRAFCLYTVIGSYSLRRILTPELNRILSGLDID